MRDLQAINHQFLIFARNESSLPAGRAVTGLSKGVLDRIGKLSLAQIEILARNLSVSLVSFRLDEAALDRLLSLPSPSQATFVMSLAADEAAREGCPTHARR